MGKRSRYIKGYRRGASTSSICERVEREGIFDSVAYHGPKGQEGVFVELRRRGCRSDLEALLNREGIPSADGYNRTLENPTRITYLSISKGRRHYGTYDPKELIRSPRHRFEKDAEKDPELKKFLEDILEHFNEV